MNLEEKWNKALKETQILKSRIRTLYSDKTTELPYIFLAESQTDIENTILREGKVLVHKPLIILPRNSPQFEGFEFTEESQELFKSFLLMRGISFPSLKYTNQLYIYKRLKLPLKEAIAYYSSVLEKKEDIHTGLIIGPQDCWQFSILLYVAILTVKSAPLDIQKLLQTFPENN
jgi:hypothetical protein